MLGKVSNHLQKKMRLNLRR
ncbi:hypothetical protein, partial [Staphylococcus argenteus]